MRTLLVAVLAFATGLWAFNAVLMPRFVHGVGDVEVPEIENRPFEQGERAAAAVGLQLSRAGERFDARIPRGYVLAQDPPPGTTVRSGRRITVVLSLGEEFASVPSLRGESRRTAKLLLEGAGLALGSIDRAPDDALGEGLVAATDPPAQAVLPRGGSVALLESAGPLPESWVMPDLIGRDVANVQRQFETLGFRVRVADTTAAYGAIVAQSPEPGARLGRGVMVRLATGSRYVQ